MRTIIATLLSFSASLVLAVEPGEDALLPAGREWITTTTASWEAAEAEGVKVWPAVRADKQARRVEVLATGAGTAEAGLLEFLLVSEKGKAYESVAVTTAKPSDIVRALKYIGMPEGRPIDYSKRRFWPRGERIRLKVVPVSADGERGETMAGSDLVKHRARKGKGEEFVFVGSAGPTEDAAGGDPMVDQTGDVISLYSNPFSVFDVHLQTPQGEHYGATTAKAEGAMSQKQRLIFVFEPEYGPDKQRLKDVAVTARAGANEEALIFGYQELPDGKIVDELTLPEVLAKLQALIEKGHDPFVAVRYAPETPLELAAEFAKMLDLAAGRGLLRVEPEAGQPYYQALLPDESWRDRKKRPGQPVEIHAKRQGDVWSGKIVRPKFVRADQGWDVVVDESTFSSLKDLQAQIAAGEAGQALFYYLPASATYAEFLLLYPHFYEMFPTQYVFLDAEE